MRNCIGTDHVEIVDERLSLVIRSKRITVPGCAAMMLPLID
jgi:hypothetical protein